MIVDIAPPPAIIRKADDLVADLARQRSATRQAMAIGAFANRKPMTSAPAVPSLNFSIPSNSQYIGQVV